MPSHIPWTEALDLVLLQCVISKGAHTCGGKKVTATWSAACDMFFGQDEILELKEESNYAKDPINSVRKVRDHYNKSV